MTHVLTLVLARTKLDQHRDILLKAQRSLHAARSDEDWLQGRVNQGLLNQGAKISTTNINVSDTNELDEWSNDHMGGHMAKRMPNGEQNEELLMDKTGCQNKDIPPTLTPLQDAAPDSTGHQEGDQSSDRHTTSLTLHNIALGTFYCMTFMMLLHMLVPTTTYQGVNLAVRALDETNLFSFVKCGPRILENYENVTRLARALLDFAARGAGLHRP